MIDGYDISLEFENIIRARYPRRIADVILDCLLTEIESSRPIESEVDCQDVDSDCEVITTSGEDYFGLPHALFKVQWTEDEYRYSRYNYRMRCWEEGDSDYELSVKVEVEILLD